MSDDFWTGATGSGATPISEDMLREAMEKADQVYQERQERVGENGRRFLASVPEHLHGHPLIIEMLTLLLADEPIHPKDHAEYKRRYQELLASDGKGTPDD